MKVQVRIDAKRLPPPPVPSVLFKIEMLSTILLQSDMIGRLLKFSIEEDEEDEDDSKGEEVDGTTIANNNRKTNKQTEKTLAACTIGAL